MLGIVQRQVPQLRSRCPQADRMMPHIILKLKSFYIKLILRLRKGRSLRHVTARMRRLINAHEPARKPGTQTAHRSNDAHGAQQRHHELPGRILKHVCKSNRVAG
jgi:hypothetical protein